MKSKKYLKILFMIFSMIISGVIVYTYYYAKNYPVSLTDNIYFDAKLKFIRENIDVNKVDTIIVGSSVGLNNIQGTYLQEASKKAEYVLNLSVNGAYARRTRQLLELSDAFPNLKRIIYSTQYTDFGVTHEYKDYDPLFLIRYIRKELNIIEELMVLFRSCNNLFFCFNRQKTWAVDHEVRNKFTSLKFDSSGSVPLDIYGDDITPGRWHGAQPGYMPEISYAAVYLMSKRAKDKGIKFYFIQQVYRQAIIDRDARVKNSMTIFPKRIRKIMEENGGIFMSLHERLHLGDKYFSDRNHMNDKGSILTAKEVARFIDENEE